MATAVEKEQKEQAISVEPWSIIADHHRNSDLLIQCIPGRFRLRSAISAAKPVKDRFGNEKIPVDQASFLGLFPPIPGMELTVNPAKLTYQITDPLEDDERLCNLIKRTLEAHSAFRSDHPIRGCPVQRGKLDAHHMKSLCREMIWLVESGDARVGKGVCPKLEAVEQLPGKFLLNPGSTIPNTQPVFEADWDSWYSNLQRSGG